MQTKERTTMALTRILVANRGEIAIRVMQAAAELGMETVAIFSEDDHASLHLRKADRACPLSGQGPAAYLDQDQVLAIAQQEGCDGIHPGYGFLSENASFARRCETAGITFIGPSSEILALFGDKARAKTWAAELGIPVLRGTTSATSLEQAETFFCRLQHGRGMVIKAIAGGGGRGMREVLHEDDLALAYQHCRSEAQQAFGLGDVYVEERLAQPRHVEIQILGDQHGQTIHLGERECSLQRRHQKIIEIAPSPHLSPALREQLAEAAMCMAQQAGFQNLGTFEFLLASPDDSSSPPYVFIEANPRLQVEHTVTEEVTGLDLVQLQLQIASGARLADLGLDHDQAPRAQGFAIQVRINMETMAPDGTVRPSGGTLSAFEPPSGRGVRVDSFGYTGYCTSANFDSLLAKLITHTPVADFPTAVNKAYRALCEFKIDGLATNIPFLQNVLIHPAFAKAKIHTTFIDEHLAALLEPAASAHHRLFFEPQAAAHAGVRVDATDPLAVLAHGKTAQREAVSVPPHASDVTTAIDVPDGMAAVQAPIQGTVVSLAVAVGDTVHAGQELLVLEAMKMEHVIQAEASGVVQQLGIAIGDTIFPGHTLALIGLQDIETVAQTDDAEVDLDYVRPDLAEIHQRHAAALDAARPEAVAKRRRTGQRTARENVEDLCDPGSFVEHGSLVLTPGSGLPLAEVMTKFPTDGMVTGVGTINGDHFDRLVARSVVLAYDYTVLAGTQGALNHPKTDRMLELAGKWRRPVVLFTEGGGGRAGTGGKRQGGGAAKDRRDDGMYRPLDTPTWSTLGRLSGLVPIVGINSGYCFAGNAAILGCCDVIIATRNSNIGMGGPAMVEGGGLGVFRPDEIGPMAVQVPNGVVDIAVEDEAEAVAVAKQYLSYFQGALQEWDAPDQRLLRRLVPENRLRIYDVRKVIETLADTGSGLELRQHFGHGMVTAFIRIEGRPIGVVANNPQHLGGAIDSDGSDKAARFLQLCDAFDIPILVLCDTPGMMVGPEVEKTALVRHCCRLFLTGANLTVPHFTIVLRKAYGLGAQAMAGGDFKQPFFAVAWPTGEFGGMGLEGQVKLGFRNELDAIDNPQARMARYNELVARAYERGKALNYGVSWGVDDVIDPMDSRHWIKNALDSVPIPDRRGPKKRRNIDAW
jgi:acetyl/propionyl-CoA carboxylase alpha subunit/acetyl-CoA carboxylase carboxyltransferase component